MRWVGPLLAIANVLTAITSAAPAAQVASVKEIVEKYDLLGTYAWDCAKPASRSNHYYVHRLIDADHLQRDMMDDPSKRAYVIVIDHLAEQKLGELSVAGNRNGKTYSAVYRVEPKRLLLFNSLIDGKAEVIDGRILNGNPMPWANKCAA
jgi:hypothetical protein